MENIHSESSIEPYLCNFFIYRKSLFFRFLYIYFSQWNFQKNFFIFFLNRLIIILLIRVIIMLLIRAKISYYSNQENMEIFNLN